MANCDTSERREMTNPDIPWVSEKSFDKFQVVPSSLKVFTTNLNGPIAPTVSWPNEGRAGRDTVGTG